MRRPRLSALTGTTELNATIERIAPAILGLLADGAPRTKAAIVEALAGRHDRQDVVLTLIRLSVTGQVEEADSKYTLGRRARTGRPRPPDPRRPPRPLRALLGAAGRGVPTRGLPPADRRPWARWRGLAGHPDEETALRGPRGAGEPPGSPIGPRPGFPLPSRPDPLKTARSRLGGGLPVRDAGAMGTASPPARGPLQALLRRRRAGPAGLPTGDLSPKGGDPVTGGVKSSSLMLRECVRARRDAV